MNLIRKKIMTPSATKRSLLFVSLIASSFLLTSCSQVGKILKSDKGDDKKDSALVVPPSLRLPSDGGASTTPAASTTNSKAAAAKARQAAKKSSKEVVDDKDYYVVVGTYPNYDQALDTFVRLSSIGLPHAAMESRKTKSGKVLHMVRLGPFHTQSQIDRVKDKLTNDGMSQFKVVIN